MKSQKNPEHRAEVYALARGGAKYTAQGLMAFGQFKLQTAAISAHLIIGLADAAVKSLEVFAGERGRGETRPASYDELLAISDGKTIKSAPPSTTR